MCICISALLYGHVLCSVVVQFKPSHQVACISVTYDVKCGLTCFR